ncbi:MAG: hypothetical protein PHS84_03180 [Paludibacter sp.]|nr:hypothetical protein [Paludibacter sp.]
MKKLIFSFIFLFVLILTALINCQETKTRLLVEGPPLVSVPPVKGPLNIPGKTLKPAKSFQSLLRFTV